MSADVFLDTNVIVYAADGAERGLKRERARSILRAGEFGISAQVLGEFYVTVTRKIGRPMSPALAARWVDRLSRAVVIAHDAVLVKAAIAGAVRWQIAYWDAAILAAAEAAGATTLYSEDLAHEQLYGTVRVVNPFVAP